MSNTQVRKNVSSFKNFSKEKEGTSLIRNLTIERVDIFVSVIEVKLSHLTFIYSKSTKETKEKAVEYVLS